MPTTPLIAMPSTKIRIRFQRCRSMPGRCRDRASLGDATLDSSVAATLAGAIPMRRLAVPFVAMNLPDPFELQNYIHLIQPLAEDTPPMTVPPRVFFKPFEPVKVPAK